MEVVIHGHVMNPAGRNLPKKSVNATARLLHRKRVVVGMTQLVAFRLLLVDLHPRLPASRVCIGPIIRGHGELIIRPLLGKRAYLEGPPLTDLDRYGA